MRKFTELELLTALTRYAGGEQLKNIATDLNISRSVLSMLLNGKYRKDLKIKWEEGNGLLPTLSVIRCARQKDRMRDETLRKGMEVYSSDGRSWLSLALCANSLGVTTSAVHKAVHYKKRVKGLWLTADVAVKEKSDSEIKELHSNTTWNIYALIDPRDPNTYHYIGQTRQGLVVRHQQHINNGTVKVAAWIQSLYQEGLRPIIKSLEEVNTQKEANIAEDRWVIFAKEKEMPILNVQINQGYVGNEIKHSSNPISVETDFGLIFDTIKSAADFFGISPLKMSKAVKYGMMYPELSEVKVRVLGESSWPLRFSTFILDSKKRVFCSIEEAASFYGIDTGLILDSINSFLPKNGIFFWEIKKRMDGKKRLGFMRPVQCVETNKAFPSVIATADYYRVTRKMMYLAINTGAQLVSFGLHFRYLEFR